MKLKELLKEYKGQDVKLGSNTSFVYCEIVYDNIEDIMNYLSNEELQRLKDLKASCEYALNNIDEIWLKRLEHRIKSLKNSQKKILENEKKILEKAQQEIKEKALQELNEEFAKLLGVSFASINRWEAGRHEPTIKIKRKIVDLCKENNISLED